MPLNNQTTPAETVTVDATLWTHIHFLITGFAVMETFRDKPAVHQEIVRLAQLIEKVGAK